MKGLLIRKKAPQIVNMPFCDGGYILSFWSSSHSSCSASIRVDLQVQQGLGLQPWTPKSSTPVSCGFCGLAFSVAHSLSSRSSEHAAISGPPSQPDFVAAKDCSLVPLLLSAALEARYCLPRGKLGGKERNTHSKNRILKADFRPDSAFIH